MTVTAPLPRPCSDLSAQVRRRLEAWVKPEGHEHSMDGRTIRARLLSNLSHPAGLASGNFRLPWDPRLRDVSLCGMCRPFAGSPSRSLKPPSEIAARL